MVRQKELVIMMLSNCKTVTEWSAVFSILWMIDYSFTSVNHEE